LILADSESTRRDLEELMGVSGARILVLYPGVEDRFRRVRQPAELERVRARYGLPRRFILGVGTLQPRKNFAGLIEAFARAKAEDLDLVIAGGPGWLYEDIREAIDRHDVEGSVHLLGFVDDVDLPALYTLATVFAFPSWYEGFGLPLLEAMACGTPVVAANNSSLPEVAGDAALLVDAASTDQLVNALHVLLTDRAQRERLIAAGHKQARGFTWARAASRLKTCYESLG
jgi:glycosyltransferase involved in cell wall biosynthesis